MLSRRTLAAAVALLCAAVAAGCGLGPGDNKGTVDLRITRDFGAEDVVAASPDVRESDTVIRLLEQEADIETRYGANFVQSIDGIEGGESDGRRYDWFFYVNGVESPQGGADIKPADGDRIWWDFRDWTTAMRVPAVVGEFPEPFVHGYEGEQPQTRIDCLGELAPCESVQGQLQAEGVKASISEAERPPEPDGGAAPALRVLVGPWARVQEDPAAAQIGEGPEISGVFARFEGQGAGARLHGLDVAGESAAGPLGAGAGLVAATRYQDDPPVWVVTGAMPAGVAAAAAAFSAEDLDGRFAVIADGGGPAIPVPVVESES